MSALMVLRCDENDCTALFAEVTTTDWALRIHAEGIGWRVDEQGDWCPSHIEPPEEGSA